MAIDLSGFGNSKNTNSMLKGCESATHVDASALTSSKNSNELLSGCTSLEEVNIGSALPEQANDMFKGTPSNKVIKTTDEEASKQIEENKQSLGLDEGSYTTTVVPPKPGDNLKITHDKLGTKIAALTEAGTYNLTIDCAGATLDRFVGNKNSDTSSEIGTGIKKAAEGVLFNIKFTNIPKGLTNTSYMLNGCSNIEKIDTSLFTQVTTANGMFKGCTGLSNIDTAVFAGVTASDGMFQGCTNLTNVDASVFTVASNTSSMFQDCTSLSSVDVSTLVKASHARDMFKNCTNLATITWGEIKPTNNTDMFSGATLPNKVIKVSSVEAKQWVDANASKMKLENYKVVGDGAAIEPPAEIPYASLDFYMSSFKAGTHSLVVDCANVEASQFKGTDATSPFGQKLLTVGPDVYFDVTLKNFDPAIIDLSCMFKDCVCLKSIDMTPFETATNTSSMFSGCSSLTTIDCSGLVKNTNTSNMFNGCSSLTTINWGAIHPATTTDMFNGASATKKFSVKNQAVIDYLSTNATGMKLTDYSTEKAQMPDTLTYDQLDDWLPYLDAGVTYTITVDCTGVAANQFAVSSYGQSYWTYTTPFGQKIQSTHAILSLKLKNIDPNITDARCLFSGCVQLSRIELLGPNNITNADAMFCGCTGLASIDTKAFTQVTDTSYMFYGCSGLTSITGTEAFTKVTNASNMFQYCSGLTSIDTSAFTQVTTAYRMFSGCSGLTSIDTKAFTQVANAGEMFLECTGLKNITWGNIKPSTNSIMFIGASATGKVITVSNAATKTWIETNAEAMHLTDYTIEVSGVIPENIQSDEISEWIPSFTEGAHNVTIDYSTASPDQFVSNSESGKSPLVTGLETAVPGSSFNLTIAVPESISDIHGFLANSKNVTSVKLTSTAPLSNISGAFENSSLTELELPTIASNATVTNAFKGCGQVTFKKSSPVQHLWIERNKSAMGLGTYQVESYYVVYFKFIQTSDNQLVISDDGTCNITIPRSDFAKVQTLEGAVRLPEGTDTSKLHVVGKPNVKLEVKEISVLL